jgi:benzylsuccinate CoA-transferase BbsF subunit
MSAPLSGLKVLDMGWLMVGPMSARYLTDLGAYTIKLESRKRRDPLRALGPFKDGKQGPERSLSYHMINAGKHSVAMNIRKEAGRDIVLKLVEWADVLIESFSPGVIDEMGYSYETLKTVNPNLIMVSTGILGRSGPRGLGTSGTGITGSAFAGATCLMGWPDRKPTGPHGPWTDSVAPRFVVSSILAALHRRKLTNAGCYIDVAQAECGLQFLLPAFLEHSANGTNPTRVGYAGSKLRSPCGIFRCKGEDRWIAIDASDQQDWISLKSVVGPPLADPGLDTIIGRIRAREAIEAALTAWTTPQDAKGVEILLQNAGVPAHVVCQAQDLTADADLRHHDHYRKISDPEIGETETTGPQFRLSVTPHVETRAAPRIGDSTKEILRDICGLSDEEITRLEGVGIVE